jgi:hypothetical protein
MDLHKSGRIEARRMQAQQYPYQTLYFPFPLVNLTTQNALYSQHLC